MSQPTIAFDIEVAGFPWEEVDEITRGYLMTRARDEKDREALPDRTGLFPGLGKIIAIGMWLVREDRGMILLEGKGAADGEHEWEKVPNSKVFRGDERDVLEKFWATVARPKGLGRLPRLVSYNGRCYDGPMLMIRSAQLGVQPSRNMIPKRWDMSEHCDLMEVLNFQGTVRDNYSLEYWCRRFDIESPKGSIDGSQVARVYRSGRIDDIGEYCLRDVRATAQLFGKLEGTILPVVSGGS